MKMPDIAIRIDHKQRQLFEKVEQVIGNRPLIFVLSVLFGKKQGLRRDLPPTSQRDKWASTAYFPSFLIAVLISLFYDDEHKTLTSIVREAEPYALGGIEYLAMMVEKDGIFSLHQLQGLYLGGDDT